MPEIKVSSQERTWNQPEVMLYVKMEWEKETKRRQMLQMEKLGNAPAQWEPLQC